MLFQLKERAHRTISSSLRYDPDRGLGVELGWEHRNFFGHGERLSVSTLYNEDEREISTRFTKPYFYHPKQSLTLSQSLGERSTEAFDERFINIATGLSRSLSDKWSANIGLGYEYTEISPKGGSRNGEQEEFSLVSLPLSATYDNRDNLLDPKQGQFLNVQFAPYFNTDQSDEDSKSFQSNIVTAMLYHPMPFWKSSTLATRVSAGSITGASKDDKDNVPLSKRFYVGGGGSVRGYPFQSIGPFEDRDGDGTLTPVGGLNFIETSIEWRMPVTKSIGVVMFADGGNSFDDFNDLNNDNDSEPAYFWGGGLGLRYFTDFGPIRFDIATPLTDLEESKNIDEELQFYFSIGQSF